jgi:hypothetical protein
MDELGIYMGIGILVCGTFGIISMVINMNKGYKGGFWWGALLGILGIIVVAAKPSKKSGQSTVINPPVNQAEQLREFKKLLDEGVISQQEYDEKKKKIINS